MINPPCLALADPTLLFEVVTDACSTGIGAVLLQQGRPIAFTGRVMTSAERNYTTTDQELLAVVYAVKQWRCYLQGAQHDFTLVTDHHPNAYFATQPQLSRRQARWFEKLQEYNFQWEYRPGKHNIADPVSRSPALCSMLQQELRDLCFDWTVKHPMLENLASAMVQQPAMINHICTAPGHCTQPADAYVSAVTRSQRAAQDADAHQHADAGSANESAEYSHHPAEQLSLLNIHTIQLSNSACCLSFQKPICRAPCLVIQLILLCDIAS